MTEYIRKQMVKKLEEEDNDWNNICKALGHGCNSVIATKTALKMADYVVTEAGFGADLGAEIRLLNDHLKISVGANDIGFIKWSNSATDSRYNILSRGRCIYST